MLRNYIKIAFRNLRKNNVDATISIGGLAVGIACCLLLVAFVQFEWSFDDFHKDGDRIYRVYSTSFSKSQTKEVNSAQMPYPFASTIEKRYPSIEQIIRIKDYSWYVKINGKFVYQEKIYEAEPGFFDVFSFPLIAGNPKTALNNSNSIVITKDKALQVFGTKNALGKEITLRFFKKNTFTVTGVMESLPQNSSLTFDYILPLDNPLSPISNELKKNWRSKFETFIMLKKNTDKASFEKNVQKFLPEYAPESWIKPRNIRLESLESFYLSPELSLRLQKSSNPVYSWVTVAIAFVVLVIAGINFMSLTLSRAAARANEISIRKVVGARRKELILQFMGEAAIICLLAFLLGEMLAEITLQWFQELVNKPVSLNILHDPLMLGIMIGVLLLLMLITGGYPALVLSRQKATSGFISHTTSGKIPRLVKGLIVVQFALAITFVSSTFIMYDQMDYISSKEKGFNPKNVVDIQLIPTSAQQAKRRYDVYSQKVRSLSQINSVTGRPVPYGSYSIESPSGLKEISSGSIDVVMIDEDFLKTMGIHVLAGRNFSKDRPSEIQNEILINEEAAQEWGWGQSVGLNFKKREKATFLSDKKVIGVINNYHIKPLFQKIKPVVFVHRDAYFMGFPRIIRVKIAAGMMEPVLKKLKTAWNALYPSDTFSYTLLKDEVQKYYGVQERWKAIMQYASAIAILLACFGLFGLASLAARRRTKEIGVRKVLGATVTNIVQLLSKDFLKLVALGFLIAVPIAWYAMNKWLADFAYKIEIGPSIFLLAGGLALLIALATVSWQSIRAALANPVDSLRSE